MGYGVIYIYLGKKIQLREYIDEVAINYFSICCVNALHGRWFAGKVEGCVYFFQLISNLSLILQQQHHPTSGSRQTMSKAIQSAMCVSFSIS